MRVKMLNTQKGVRAGQIYPETFAAGEEYEIDDRLLGCFISLGAVELLDVEECDPKECPACDEAECENNEPEPAEAPAKKGGKK